MRIHRAASLRKIRPLAGCLTLALLSASLSRADAVVQISFRDQFNADVIVNGTSGDYDVEMDTIEGEWAFATASAGASSGCPNNLPDDGYFSAHDNHPEVRLGWDQTDDGLNSWVTTGAASIQVPVPRFHYDAIDLFAVGAYTPELEVTLQYDSGPNDVYAGIRYPTWFDPTIGYGFYDLIDGRDRAKLNKGSYVCENSATPAIVGHSFPADPTRTLVSIALERTDTEPGSWLTVFGAVGSLARTVTDYDLSSQFNVDVVSNQDGDPCSIDATYDTIEGTYLPATTAVHHCLPPFSDFGSLPDDGVFPAAAVRPKFGLGFDYLDSGDNARQSDNTGDLFAIDVPDAALDEIHVFGISAGGGTDFEVELQYTAGTPESHPVEIPDWITDPPWASAETYFLTRDLDAHSKGKTWTITDFDGLALVGVRIPADRRRTLTGVTVIRPASDGPEGLGFPLLSIYGVSGVATSGLLFYDGFEWVDLKNWSNF